MTLDVLIIDDDKAIRDILTNVLEDEGYTVRTGGNSDEALAEFKKTPPTVVVLDVWLNNSKLDGVEILTEMKSINENVPVIMISGHGTVDMAVSATKKGAYDFLSKPFNTESLLVTISRAVNKRTEKLELLLNELMDYRAKSNSTEPKSFDDDAIKLLSEQNWLGNIGGLVNVLDKLLVNVKSSTVKAVDVKKCLSEKTSENKKESNNVGMEDIFMLDLRKSREMFEKHYLTFHLKRFNGNITQTSEYVGMDRAALSRKIKALDIKIDG